MKLAGKTNNERKRRRKQSQRHEVHLGPAVARYLFSPRHAFVFKTMLECAAPQTTAFLVARQCRLSVDMVDFIIADLVRARLVKRADRLFQPEPASTIDDGIKRLADPDLVTLTREYRAWEQEGHGAPNNLPARVP